MASSRATPTGRTIKPGKQRTDDHALPFPFLNGIPITGNSTFSFVPAYAFSSVKSVMKKRFVLTAPVTLAGTHRPLLSDLAHVHCPC
jgi:hypothetical protein